VRTPGLFDGWWADMAGSPIRRATRRELAHAYRLWMKHADIRRGADLDLGEWIEALPKDTQG
jgi:hypothetical protein